MKKPSLNIEKALSVCAALCAIVYFILALIASQSRLGLRPEADAMDYRIPLVKAIVSDGYPNWNWTYVDEYPPFAEILMAIAMRLGISMRLVVLSGVALALVAGYLFAKRVKLSRAALVAAVFGIWTYAAQIQSVILLTDFFAASLMMLGVVLIQTELKGPKQKISVQHFFGALSLGLAWFTKYYLWPLLGITTLLLWIECNIHLKWKRKQYVTAVLFLSTVPMLYWCWRNWTLVGNPVFPLVNSIFQSPHLSLEHFQRISRFYDGYGLPLNPVSFVIAPIYLWLKPSLFDYPTGHVWPFLLLLATLGFAKGTIERRQKIFWGAFLFLSYALWFFSAQQTRFLFPTFITVGWIASVGAYSILQVRQLKRVPVILGFVVLGIGFYAGAKYEMRHVLAFFFPHNEFFQKKTYADQTESLMSAINRMVTTNDVVGVFTRTNDLGLLESSGFAFVFPHPYATSISPQVTHLYGHCSPSGRGQVPNQIQFGKLLAKSPAGLFCFWKAN